MDGLLLGLRVHALLGGDGAGALDEAGRAGDAAAGTPVPLADHQPGAMTMMMMMMMICAIGRRVYWVITQ